ncbi:MAG: hypothetical protein JWR07_321, partial [Nevskia sp.]|nr:hypothetical protein [Nevskia sp.]
MRVQTQEVNAMKQLSGMDSMFLNLET